MAEPHLLDVDDGVLRVPAFDDVYGDNGWDDSEELYGDDDPVNDLDADDDFIADDVDDDDDLGVDDDEDDPYSAPSPPGAFHPQPSPPSSYKQMCVICQVRPAYSRNGKSYTTCGLTCRDKLEKAKQRSTSSYSPSISSIPSSSSLYPSSSSSSQYNTPIRRAQNQRGTPPRSASGPSRGRGYASSGSPPQYHSSHSGIATPASPTDQNLHLLSQYLSGARISGRGTEDNDSLLPDGNLGGSPTSTHNSGTQPRRLFGIAKPRPLLAPVQKPPSDPCVVCKVKPCYDNKYITCGLKCAKKLCDPTAKVDKNLCTYCRRKPKLSPHNQCGQTCRDAAKVACLMCKTRPKHGRYHLCGKTCKLLATENTPLILEAPVDHETFDSVVKKFTKSWTAGGTMPTIKAVYKIIENKSFLTPYDKYKKQIGASTEVFRYHGTSRKCTLGTNGNTKLCNASNCALCCILKTSFKVALANPSGAFGAGVYSSSASNKAYSYAASGSGAMILCKVVIGNPRMVTTWNEVMSCPAGFNSVVYDRKVGTTNLNETIVYTDDAIRPVFLMTF